MASEIIAAGFVILVMCCCMLMVTRSGASMVSDIFGPEWIVIGFIGAAIVMIEQYVRGKNEID